MVKKKLPGDRQISMVKKKTSQKIEPSKPNTDKQNTIVDEDDPEGPIDFDGEDEFGFKDDDIGEEAK
jgi:hypothetical protein